VIGGESSRWKAAIDRLKEQGTEGSVGVACREVILWVHAPGATLEFWAENGRSTVRVLEDPSELTSTLAALSFVPFAKKAENVSEQGRENAPMSHADARLASSPDTEAYPKRAPSVPEEAESAHARRSERGGTEREPESSSSSPRSPLYDAALVAVEGGVRTGSDRLLTPILDAFFALALDHTELGVTARYEARHASIGAVDAAGYGMALGVRVARRYPWANLSVLLGGQAQLAVVTQPARQADPRAKESRAEARVGAYTGLSLANAGSLRLRTTLGFELVPSNLGRSARDAGEPPLSPWGAVTWGVGGEFGGA
jgi:hypothetical protein